MKYKIIHDPVHGSIRITDLFLDLTQTPEMQRLYGIKQLGMTYLVYPGATHTRFEHSLGTFQIAKRLARSLGIKDYDFNLLLSAALLHDVGHGPFSHTLDHIYRELLNTDHVEITKKIIEGKYSTIPSSDRKYLEAETIPEILERYEIRPKDVSKIISDTIPKKKYLGQVIHGGMDVDRLDYLLRDAHYTGAVHGLIDLSRFISVAEIHKNELVISRNGITTIEQMLIGRTIMYISVYFHKTVRIAECMLSSAVERIADKMENLIRFNDCDLVKMLEREKGYVENIVKRLKYRKLYKKAYLLPVRDVDSSSRKRLLEISENIEARHSFEDEICKRANIPKGSVVVDIPSRKVLNQRRQKYSTGIKVLFGSRLKPIEEFTPLAEFLEKRYIPEWAMLVASDERYVRRVENILKKMF